MSLLKRLFASETKPKATRKKQAHVWLAESDGEWFDIVGESHYQQALEKVAGPKTADSKEVDVDVVLRPEPDNPYDSNAVAVLIEGHKVGHLSRDHTLAIIRLLRQSQAEAALCEGEIVGGWINDHSEGHYGVQLDIAWPPEIRD